MSQRCDCRPLLPLRCWLDSARVADLDESVYATQRGRKRNRALILIAISVTSLRGAYHLTPGTAIFDL